jgi:hypothetical protein
MSSTTPVTSSLVDGPPFTARDAAHGKALFEALRGGIAAATVNPRYANYVRHWPIPLRDAQRVADLPFLPVTAFKTTPPLATVPEAEWVQVLQSSGTTGQIRSQIVIDKPTALRMTKAAATIIADFIGPSRRPMLVIDDPNATRSGGFLNARGAAIRGLLPFGRDVTYAGRQAADGSIELDEQAVAGFLARHGTEGPVLVYGFTYILWSALERIAREGRSFGLQQAYVLHSGGWKTLVARAIDKVVFNATIGAVIGCGPERIVDFYGMVENVGVVYPDCPNGNKHAPAFGEVIIRDPLSLEPCDGGATGIVQVCSTLPTSFPGHVLLTEDLAEVMHTDGCPCGRPGVAFRFKGRAPKAELRGCGDVAARRQIA